MYRSGGHGPKEGWLQKGGEGEGEAAALGASVGTSGLEGATALKEEEAEREGDKQEMSGLRHS